MNLVRSIAVLLFAFCALPTAAQVATQRITLTISVTNRPVTSNTLVVNSSTRTWTNTSSSTYIPTNLVSTATSATNLYNQIANFPYSGGIAPRWLSETSMALIAPLGAALSASQSGAWAILTLSTQSGPNTFTALWPLENIAGPAVNKTNQASAFVSGLGSFSTNAFPTNSTVNSNFITKGASPDQFITSPLRVTGTLRATSQLLATNGFTSAITNINPVSSNLVNYGNAIRSEGSGGNSLQVGSNALALSLRSMAIGNGSIATNTDSMAIGTGAVATNTSAMAIGTGALGDGVQAIAIGSGTTIARGDGATVVGGNAAATALSVAVGNGASASGTNAVAIGQEALVNAAGYKGVSVGDNSSVSAPHSVAIGAGAGASHSNSVAIGVLSATTTTNQLRLGTASETVSVPGQLLVSGSQSNTTFTGTNVVNGRVDFTSRAYTGMVNGNNGPITLGTNTYVRLSGATTIGVLCSFEAEQDGSYHIVKLTGAITNTVANESGFDGTVARRIITGTGGDVSFTNNPCILQFIYDAALARWQLMGLHR